MVSVHSLAQLVSRLLADTPRPSYAALAVASRVE
jgi:hypothetical protein